MWLSHDDRGSHTKTGFVLTEKEPSLLLFLFLFEEKEGKKKKKYIHAETMPNASALFIYCQRYQPTNTTNNLSLRVCTHFDMIGRISKI